MRKDMAKVIVERPRVGGNGERKGRAPRDPEDLPTKVSMRKSYSGRGRDRKQFNENLKPLERFLEKNINRKWDKVYSEICENLKATSTIQQHVRDHLKHMVELNVLKRGKKIFYKSSYWRNENVELRYKTLYVDPATGYLREYLLNKWVRRNSSARHIPDWETALNSIIYKAKGRTAFIDGVVFKVYKQDDKEVHTPAMRHHALLDYNSGEFWGRFRTFPYGEGQGVWISFFKKYGSQLPRKSGYINHLAELSKVYF